MYIMHANQIMALSISVSSNINHFTAGDIALFNNFEMDQMFKPVVILLSLRIYFSGAGDRM